MTTRVQQAPKTSRWVRKALVPPNAGPSRGTKSERGTSKSRTRRHPVGSEGTEARLAILGQAQERRAHATRVLAALEAFARSVGQGLETADFAKRQQVIRLMVERVVVEQDGQLRIDLANPLGGHGGGGSGGQRDPQPPEGPGLGLWVHLS